jgi:hypothetical protein
MFIAQPKDIRNGSTHAPGRHWPAISRFQDSTGQRRAGTIETVDTGR